MSAIPALTCNNEASPRGAGNTAEGSNPEIAYTIGGLRVSVPTNSQQRLIQRNACIPWEGRPREYQGEAKVAIAHRLGAGHEVPWIYVTPTCETRMCLRAQHIRSFTARRIAYPAGVCVYCGMPGYTRDHLLPVTLTGEAVRKFVATVPACHECNSGINDRCGYRISERREEAHRLIRKRHRKVLEAGRRWTKADLAELGPNLRSMVERSLQQREVVMERLAWPHDPDYDRRAFEKSGFDDPIAMELI